MCMAFSFYIFSLWSTEENLLLKNTVVAFLKPVNLVLSSPPNVIECWWWLQHYLPITSRPDNHILISHLYVRQHLRYFRVMPFCNLPQHMRPQAQTLKGGSQFSLSEVNKTFYGFFSAQPVKSRMCQRGGKWENYIITLYSYKSQFLTVEPVIVKPAILWPQLQVLICFGGSHHIAVGVHCKTLDSALSPISNSK